MWKFFNGDQNLISFKNIQHTSNFHLSKIISDKVSEFWNLFWFQTIFPKNLKSGKIQTVCQKSLFTNKLTHSHKMDRFFWLNFQQLFCSWIQQIFYSCQIVWIHPRNPKPFHTILQLVSELGYISSWGCAMEATWYATKMFCILNKYQMCWPQFSYETKKIQGKIMLDITEQK